MIKIGLELFTTTGQIIENNSKYTNCSCCSICTSPYICFCMMFCKYRSATFGEFIEKQLKNKQAIK